MHSKMSQFSARRLLLLTGGQDPPMIGKSIYGTFPKRNIIIKFHYGHICFTRVRLFLTPQFRDLQTECLKN